MPIDAPTVDQTQVVITVQRLSPLAIFLPADTEFRLRDPLLTNGLESPRMDGASRTHSLRGPVRQLAVFRLWEEARSDPSAHLRLSLT